MSFLRRPNLHEMGTSSELDEDEEDEEEMGFQDGSTDEGSDIESSQLKPLIKIPNGNARNSVSHSRVNSTEDALDGETILSSQTNGEINKDHHPIRNGSVYVHIADDEHPAGLESSDIHRYRTKEADLGVRKKKSYPKELKKVAVAAVFTLCNFVATAASLSIVHEYYPIVDPLPDRILDSVPYQSWGLKACEILLTVHTTLAVLTVVFHKHRFIVMRRVLLILGLLYGYRAITMFVTVLPRADKTYYCSPKMSDEGKSLTFLTIVARVFNILSGFGLTINGKHTFCGDYIFSGHTMMFVLTYLVISEYTSRRFYPFHWLLWMSGVCGVTMLLFGRGHYTIDCIIAYYITTRLWYIYHSMACHPALKRPTKINYFVKIWWWYLFRWFEENVRSGPLPNGFSLPISKKFYLCLFSKSRELVSETSRLTRRSKAKMSKQEA